MKVIHFISGFAPGGAEVYVKSLAIGLMEKGVISVVYGIDDQEGTPHSLFQSEFVAELERHGIGYGFVGGNARRNPILGFRRFRSIIESSGADVVHVHLTYAAIYACLASGGKPIVFTHHSTPVRSPLAQRLLLRRRTARYIAVSRSGRDALLHEARIAPGKISIILNGVDLSLYRSREGRPLSGGRCVIIAVGGLRPEKDYPALLRALAVVVDRCVREGLTPPKLQILGDGPERPQLDRITRELGLGPHVQFLGTRTDVPQLLQDADIFAMSSACEGFSIALLEALASGLPVVVTDVGGNGEIVEDGVCGYLTRPNVVADLAEKLFFLIRRPDLRLQFSLRARERAEAFSLSRSVAAHAKVYEELLGLRN